MPNQAPSALSELRDIHLPVPEAWWVLAPGWWLLLVLIVLLIVVLWKYQAQLKVLLKSHQSKKELKSAVLHELVLMRKQYEETSDAQALLQSLSIFLRRVAKSVFEQQQVIGKIEDEWLSFLDEQWAQNKPEQSFMSPQIAELLNVAVYKPSLTDDEVKQVEALLRLTELWVAQVVKHHV